MASLGLLRSRTLSGFNDMPADDWHRRKQYFETPERKSVAFVDSGGNGPALLMLHGFSDTSRSFAALERFFPDFRVIVPDFPGHGSSALDGGVRIEDFAASIDRLLESLGLSRISVVGHSMGAMTAIELAARRRDGVSALILLSGSLRPDFGAESPLARDIRALRDPIDPSGQFLRDWYACSRPVDSGFLSKMKLDAAAMPAATWHGILDGFGETDLRCSAARVTAPVLCIAGSADPLFGGSHQEALGHAFQTVRSIRLEGCGHNPHWEYPERVSALISAFLAETARI
nr:alpha/beta hydrolase [Rhizobium hidalgonense]